MTADMNRELVSKWEQFGEGLISAVEMAEAILASERAAPIDPTVRIDSDRRRRCGYSEVVYAAGKSDDQLFAAIDGVLAASLAGECLVTRADDSQAQAVMARFQNCRWQPQARTIRLRGDSDLINSPEQLLAKAAAEDCPVFVNVVAAGSTDAAVVEEARETLAWMDRPSRAIVDIGVAGLHRSLRQLPLLRSAAVNIVVAGMEGALASVIGGLVATPVIAVPTSVGYGANFGGVAALLAMLNSCSANVSVVNIDSGFKAGYLAGLVCDQINRFSNSPSPLNTDR